MGRRRSSTVTQAPPLPADGGRLVTLRRSGVLDHSPDPELDRWTVALRRSTGAAVAALCFLDDSCRLLKSVCTGDGSAAQVSELALSEPLEHHVAGLVRQTGSTGHGGWVYAEAPITVDGQLLGQIGLADGHRRDWTEADLEALADSATAISTAIALRLAKKDAQRVQELVTSHNKVHDLISRGASLRDVLAETRGGLRLVYQPVFALPTMQIVGLEALLRWSSPTIGEVAPAELVPVAEDTGTIVPIGAWVLRESCETIAGAEPASPVELHVNVSGRQVSDPDFPLLVRQTLAHAGLPSDLLALEITETSLARPNAVASRNLHALNALGVRIVLDDFGGEHSSLSWLKQHPFSAIKIDRGLIAGVAERSDDYAIVASVIGMADALDCTVTAKGVETEEQLAALLHLGCERAQGFLLGRPVPASEAGGLLTTPEHPRGTVKAA